jgi:hypothetical protein
MDAVATAVAELVLSHRPLPPLLNVVHPRPVPWSDIIAGFQCTLAKPLRLVSIEEWLHVVENIATENKPEDLQRVVSIA